MSRRGPTPRMRRVNELLREVVAEAVADLKDPRIGFVTITGVETAADLRRATVFYTVLGSDQERHATAAALSSAAPHIQQQVGRQVRLKYLPKLAFEPDEAVERGVRIAKLLHDIAEEERDRDRGGTEPGG